MFQRFPGKKFGVDPYADLNRSLDQTKRAEAQGVDLSPLEQMEYEQRMERNPNFSLSSLNPNEQMQLDAINSGQFTPLTPSYKSALQNKAEMNSFINPAPKPFQSNFGDDFNFQKSMEKDAAANAAAADQKSRSNEFDNFNRFLKMQEANKSEPMKFASIREALQKRGF
jgi:hypothetical protein